MTPLPPIFWSRYLADLRAEHAGDASKIERLEAAIKIANVGIGPLVELIGRLSYELERREFIFCKGKPPRCRSCHVHDGAGSEPHYDEELEAWALEHESSCPVLEALSEAADVLTSDE